MPRKPRFFLADIPVHVVQRGHSREPVFFEDSDYRAYLDWLTQAATRYRCAIHAYVLMTNHIHVLATPNGPEGVSRMMQYVGRRYVPYVNHTYGTSGSIWEGRYKASLIQDEEYLLTCMRYIELNPVRANMTGTPGQYRWSSYRVNAQGREDKLITPHPLYNTVSGGRVPVARRPTGPCSRRISTRRTLRTSARPGKPGHRLVTTTSKKGLSENLRPRWAKRDEGGLRKGL